MRQVDLTPGGPRVSMLGLGCNNFGHNPFGTFLDDEATRAVVDAALDAGVTAFDTADVYASGESETYLGRALVGHRDDVAIATKWGYEMPGAPDVPHGRSAYIRWALESSLKRLQTDRVDLYQLHRADPQTPIAETLGVLAELAAEGKIRHVGTSMSSAAELFDASEVHVTDPRLPAVGSCMTQYSLLHRDPEDEVIPACERLGISLLPFFPLESGLLTGKYAREGHAAAGRLREQMSDVSEETWAQLDALQAFAAARDASLLEVALGGLAREPVVSVVFAGATRPEQVRQNAEAIAWEATDEDFETLRGLTRSQVKGREK